MKSIAQTTDRPVRAVAYRKHQSTDWWRWNDADAHRPVPRTGPAHPADAGHQGTMARPSAMPMDAWRDGDTFVVELDLPGVQPESIDVDVERNVVTVRAERPARNDDAEMLAAERPRGVFSRQLVLGDNLDTDNITASYDAGVLTLKIPVAERPNPARSPSAATTMTATSSSTNQPIELSTRQRLNSGGEDSDRTIDQDHRAAGCVRGCRLRR